VNRVVPADKLMEESEKMLRTMIENGPLALQVCIEAVDSALDASVDEGLLLEANYFGLLASTQDMREGMAAFLEKRKANFTGR
jgi:enoyl-CoA hydratase